MQTLRIGALAACVLACTAVAAAENVRLVDRGTYKVYQNDRPLGAETFGMEEHGDTLLVTSQVFQAIPTPEGATKLEKNMRLLANRVDLGLVLYESKQIFRGRTLSRGLVLKDTSFVSYREVDGSGEGVGLVLPPGRLFVLDPQVFVLFDLIGRTLYDRAFESRPITVMLLAERDSVLDATVTNLGNETIRWGAKPVQALKLGIADSGQRGRFVMWLSPQGEMLRLEQPESGLRVERDAPAVKRRTPRGG